MDKEDFTDPRKINFQNNRVMIILLYLISYYVQLISTNHTHCWHVYYKYLYFKWNLNLNK